VKGLRGCGEGAARLGGAGSLGAPGDWLAGRLRALWLRFSAGAGAGAWRRRRVSGWNAFFWLRGGGSAVRRALPRDLTRFWPGRLGFQRPAPGAWIVARRGVVLSAPWIVRGRAPVSQAGALRGLRARAAARRVMAAGGSRVARGDPRGGRLAGCPGCCAVATPARNRAAPAPLETTLRARRLSRLWQGSGTPLGGITCGFGWRRGRRGRAGCGG